MKNYGYFALGCGAGAFLGVGFSYLVLKKRMEEREKAEIQSVKDAFNDISKVDFTDGSKNEEKSEKKEDKKPKSEKQTSSHPEIKAHREQSSLVRPADTSVKTDYRRYFKGNADDLSDPEDIEEAKAEAESPSEKASLPYKVPRSAEDGIYDDPTMSENIISCTVFMGGSEPVLTEDTDPEHLSMDIYSTVGGPDWSDFLANKDDDDRLFVDPRTSIVYEVSKDDSDYEEIMEDYYGGNGL